jgi:hypothetical protein
MIRSAVRTRISPEIIWHSFSRTFSAENGKNGRFKYRILSINEGESFTLLWKTFFARLVFTYAVVPCQTGAEISTQVEIRGIFSRILHYFLKNKIQRSLDLSLHELVKKLANHS